MRVSTTTSYVLFSLKLMCLIKAVSCFVLLENPTSSAIVGSASNRYHHYQKQQQQIYHVLASSSSSDDDGGVDLTPQEERAYQFMKEIHDSGYPFRVVVVGGRGTILETTTVLGPVQKVSPSPSSGANLLTLASMDQSFEFHMQLSLVSKIMLVAKEIPSKNKVMRIVRVLNAAEESMCSLILAATAAPGERNIDAEEWFDNLLSKHGNTVEVQQ